MSTETEERYVDLKKICEKCEPKLFDTLSWILLINLDLIPFDDLKAHKNLLFSYHLMNQDYKEAKYLAEELASTSLPISKYYKDLLVYDPDLSKTKEISEMFFHLSKRRIEIAEKLGIHQD